MISSNTHKYIFVGVPKTGTRSIQKFLVDHDPSAMFNKVVLENEEHIFADKAKASEIKSVLKSAYSGYRTFAFIRHPYSKLVSSYFFYKNGQPIVDNSWKAFIKAPIKRKLSLVFTHLKIVSTRFLPFEIWSLIYPYKTNLEYITKEGEVIVSYVGRYEKLEEDFFRILKELGVDLEVNSLPHVNKSKHKSYQDYFKRSWYLKLVNRKVKSDLDYYNKITSELEN